MSICLHTEILSGLKLLNIFYILVHTVYYGLFREHPDVHCFFLVDSLLVQNRDNHSTL